VGNIINPSNKIKNIFEVVNALIFNGGVVSTATTASVENSILEARHN
jgi:hypothetical protein